MIDLTHLLAGEITRVQARLSTRVPKPHPENMDYEPACDSASLTVQLANGGTATIFTSAAVQMGNRIQGQRFFLAGSAGTLEVEADGIRYEVRGLRAGETEYQTLPIPDEFLVGSNANATPFEQMGQTFSQQSIGTRLFIDSILQDCPIVPGFHEGAQAQAVIDAAFRSNASGCWEGVENV
jgi:predicted dehydrogenase